MSTHHRSKAHTRALSIAEILIALGLIAMTTSFVVYGMVTMNQRAMYGRNITAGADLLRGVCEMALTLPYDGFDTTAGPTTDPELNLLQTTATVGNAGYNNPRRTLSDAYPNPDTYRLLSLGVRSELSSTPGDVTTYQKLPLYNSKDPAVATSGDPALTPLVNGELQRSVLPVTDSVAVSGEDETATDLKLVRVDFSLTYQFQGRNRTTTVTTFRAPTR